ncbi:MAG TPA: LytR C-terminal domain-containing protein [Candidatus Eisenbacteria bacterium]|nr:LytR C-terminal domain-containing protein [Candidatus Eisenbacteria bacterium]
MAKKAARGARLLDWTLAALFVVIAALGVSTALRVGPQSVGRPKRPLRIELLNGSGRSGLAGELASYLRDGGFDVLLVSNADRSDYRNTLVVNRTETPEPGNIVADYLGTRHVIQQIRAQEMIDVTVIVGRDARRWTQPR